MHSLSSGGAFSLPTPQLRTRMSSTSTKSGGRNTRPHLPAFRDTHKFQSSLVASGLFFHHRYRLHSTRFASFSLTHALF